MDRCATSNCIKSASVFKYELLIADGADALSRFRQEIARGWPADSKSKSGFRERSSNGDRLDDSRSLSGIPLRRYVRLESVFHENLPDTFPRQTDSARDLRSSFAIIIQSQNLDLMPVRVGMSPSTYVDDYRWVGVYWIAMKTHALTLAARAFAKRSPAAARCSSDISRGARKGFVFCR